MVVVGLNAIDMMFFIPAYLFWALVIIAVDVVALYALCTYGSRENQPSNPRTPYCRLAGPPMARPVNPEPSAVAAYVGPVSGGPGRASRIPCRG